MHGQLAHQHSITSATCEGILAKALDLEGIGVKGKAQQTKDYGLKNYDALAAQMPDLLLWAQLLAPANLAAMPCRHTQPGQHSLAFQ